MRKQVEGITWPGVETKSQSCDDSAFIQSVQSNALRGKLPTRDDILRLLSYAPESEQTRILGKYARETARQVAGNKAYLWAAIGVDSRPCVMNCSFCSFGAKWGVITGSHEWSDDEVCRTAHDLASQGAAWIVLRTTEHYGLDRLCALARKVRSQVPKTCALVVNTGQHNTPDDYAILKDSGITLAYHALRLGEGRDTPFTSTSRMDTLQKIKASSLGLAHLVEPLGPEHSNGEIADVLLTALEAGAEVCGSMARVNVPGTPFGGSRSVSEERLAQVTAITRLCGGSRTPFICVHPPVEQAVAWGANVVVIETGGVPRDEKTIEGEWRGFSLQRAQEIFLRNDYELANR